MVEADPVVRSARNGFFVLIVGLFVAGMYQILLIENQTVLIPTLWSVGVVVFYGSKYYYRHRETGAE